VDGNPSLIPFFDQVRIINLASRTDRRRETETEFTGLGHAIDGNRTAFFDAIAPQTANGFPNAAVRGCFLSHLAVLEEAHSAGAAHVLVLEDDIAFVRDIEALGAEAVRQLDGLDWDIAYFGHAQGSRPGAPTWLPVTGPMQHAHFYAVSRKALSRMIEFLHIVHDRKPGHPAGGPMHYDGALTTFIEQNPDIQAVYISRNLGYQRPSRTDLHPVSLLDRHVLLAPVRFLYRTIKRTFWHITR